MEIKSPGPVPKEAISYFNNKVSVPGFDYRDIWTEEHAHGFTVAKAMQLDVRESIQTALSKALNEGQTLRDFSKNLTPELQRLGWWGKSEMVDPLTGDVVPVQLGSPRRLKTIFNANMRTARAAGQWERAERTKKALPFMIYELGPSREHRVDHAAWHGTLLPIDDPWWDTHMTPNGWGCKCRVRQVSRFEAERLGKEGVPAPDRKQEINPETGLPTGRMEKTRVPVKTTAPKTEYVEWKNKRKGTVELVPEGIDPGWDTNPGKVRQQNLESLLAGKIDGLKTDVERTVVMRDLASSGRFERWVDHVNSKEWKHNGEHHIVGVISDRVKTFLEEKKGITLHTRPIIITDERVFHSGREEKQKKKKTISVEDTRSLPSKMLNAKIIWDDGDPLDNPPARGLLYVFDAIDEKGRVAKAVVRINEEIDKTISNRVKTTGLVQANNLKAKRYTVIQEAEK